MSDVDLENLVGSLYQANLVALDRIIHTSSLSEVTLGLLKRCIRIRNLIQEALYEVGLLDGIK